MKIRYSNSYYPRRIRSSGEYGRPLREFSSIDSRYDYSHTPTLKIAISVPDPIHEVAERYAARRGISRSELYRRALQAYLRREDEIVEQLDAVYAREDSSVDPVLEELQRRTLARDDREARSRERRSG